MTQPLTPEDGLQATADGRRLIEKQRMQQMLNHLSADLSHRFMLEEALRAKIGQRDIEIIKLKADKASMKAAMDRRSPVVYEALIKRLEDTEDTLCMESNDRAANTCKLASAALSHLQSDEPGVQRQIQAACDLLKPLATGVHDVEQWPASQTFYNPHVPQEDDPNEINVLDNDPYDHSMGDDPYNEWNTWPPYMMEILNPKK